VAAGGYFGRALVVDAGTAAASVLPLSDDLLRAYLGGAGLGAWLMHRLAPPRVDPLAPEAPLAFVFSPLVGTPLTTSAKFAVVAKSPLTGMLNDALSSSHFAISGKLTGNDAIVIRGACRRLSALLVDGDGARLADAEAAQVASYLYQGEPLLITNAAMDDVVDTERRNCVPTITSAKGSTLTPHPLFDAGYSPAICAPMPSICARAFCSVTPGLSNANEVSQ